jgi:WG containing repeat
MATPFFLPMRKKITYLIGFCLLLSLVVGAQARLVSRTARPAITKTLIPIRQNHQWGYADTARHIIISPQFDVANPFEGSYAIVEKKQKAYAIDSTGRILTPGFDQLFVMSDTILSIYLNEESDTLGGWGIATLSGKTILKPAYAEVAFLTTNLFVFRKDSLWGLVDRSGKILLQPEYNSIELAPSSCLITKKRNLFGVLDLDGNRLLDENYFNVSILTWNAIAGCQFDKKRKKEINWGAVNRNADIIVPFRFDSLYRINAYFLAAKMKDTLAVYFPAVNGNGTELRYKSQRQLGLCWLYLYDFKKNMGLVDSAGRMIVPCMYADIRPGGNGFWFVADTNKLWSIYSPDGNKFFDPTFDQIIPFRGPVTVVKKNNQQGLVNMFGEIIEPLGDQEIIVRRGSAKILRKNGSATFLRFDENGRVTDRGEYDEMRVIKIGGREAPVTTNFGAGQGQFRSAGAILAPRVDSLFWFYSIDQAQYGLVNQFTSDTIINPAFDFVLPLSFTNFTVVGIRDSREAMVIDIYQTKSQSRVGLINDSTGEYVLRLNYLKIYTEDLIRSNGFHGYIRALLPGGQMALVSLDGTERKIPFTWIDQPQNGYARFCIEGKWTLDGKGENMGELGQFSTIQTFDPRESFGKAYLSKSFMNKNLILAGGKWGYLDSTGSIVVPAIYDGAKSPMVGTGIVQQGKKWGLIDMHNTVRIPCAYDALSYMCMRDTILVVPQNNAIRYGYIDRNGNLVIPADLKLAKSLGYGFIGFSKTGKWGVMKVTGESVCAEMYHEILPFSEGLAAVRKGNRWGYIDTSGQEVIALKFEKAGDFQEGLARMVLKGRWGYIDYSGAEIIAPQFMQAGNFSKGAAPVRSRDGFGLISRDGKWLLRPEWRSIEQLDSSSGGFFVVRNDFLSGVCRSDGKMILYPRYDKFKWLDEGCIAFLAGTQWGLMDTMGKQLLPASFDMIKPFTQHLAPAYQLRKWGYIHADGSFAIRPSFDYAGNYFDNRAYVLLGKQSMFIDTSGKVILKLQRDFSLMAYSEGKYVVARLDEKKEIIGMYYLTRHGVNVSPFIYKEALPFENGAGRVRSNSGTWGLVSYTGYYLVKPRYYSLGSFDHGVAPCKLISQQGLFSLDGKQILPVAYDLVSYDQGLELIRIEKGNSMGWMFEDGQVCWPESE